ncbi:MAG: hypothetical protein OK449_01015, partial [Thaumarchaeota archaeon]|nr:hypothetical protein [Nitrososphaerota archaeon]
MSNGRQSRPDATLSSTLTVIVILVTLTTTMSYYAINYPAGSSAASTTTTSTFTSSTSLSTSSQSATSQSSGQTTVDDGGYSYSVAYDSTRGELFVANSQAGTISIISDSTNTVVA